LADDEDEYDAEFAKWIALIEHQRKRLKWDGHIRWMKNKDGQLEYHKGDHKDNEREDDQNKPGCNRFNKI
jgi:hypothetical protein